VKRARWWSIAAGGAGLLALYVGARLLFSPVDRIETVSAVTVPTLDKPIASDRGPRSGMTVAVRRSVAERRPIIISLSGKTGAARTVTVRAEGSGRVAEAPAVEGRLVRRGDLLCGMDPGAAAARLREAEAQVASHEIEFNAAQELAQKGWANEARVRASEAQLQASRAALEVASQDLSRFEVRAPFAGVFESRSAEVGELLSPGDACGIMVELNPLLVTAAAGQRSADKIVRGQKARLRLSDGTVADGAVRSVSRTLDPETQTYRVEIQFANPRGAIGAGRIAEVQIETGAGDAHKVNPLLLTTDEQGRLGVRYLDLGGVVSFAPADVVDQEVDGVWVSGLPQEALIIAEGQTDVRVGVRATPLYRDDPPSR
jgi:multidrug efflux system membrane fusion protein